METGDGEAAAQAENSGAGGTGRDRVSGECCVQGSAEVGGTGQLPGSPDEGQGGREPTCWVHPAATD